MKKTILSIILAVATISAAAQEKILEPKSITPMPKITKAEWQTYYELRDEGRAPKDINKYGDLTVYEDLYAEYCSWYCGGEVKSVTATSCLKPIKSFNYKGENAHDFNHESVWATDGNGKPYAILALQDSRTLQCFDVGTLGFHDDAKPDWTLKFEILEVYPGSKHDDTVIAELYFDGIDVH